jgi:HSP20 family protein
MASRYLTPWSAARGSWLSDPVFQLQREIDRVFEDAFSGGGSGGSRSQGSTMSAPRIDVREAEGELRVHADLPGVKPSDLDVRVDGDVLTIRGERKSESERNEHDFHVMERSHGRFQRSIQLPFTPNPDEVHAEVREGVLEIRIPKRGPQERSRRIEVRGGESRASGAQSIGGGSGAAMTQAVGGGSSASGSSDGDRGGGGEAKRSGSAESGTVGQGPGGSSSAAPGVGGGAQGDDGGGLAGVGGGPTSAPAGQSSSAPAKR